MKSPIANPARGGLGVFPGCAVGIRSTRVPLVNRIHFPWELRRANRRGPSIVNPSGFTAPVPGLELSEFGQPRLLALSIHQNRKAEHG